jgi:hypothetical protein
MTPRRQLFAAFASLCPAAAVTISVAFAHAQPIQVHQSSATSLPALAVTPKPKPKTTMKLIKSGARVNVTEQQTRRQEINPRLLPKKPSRPVADSLIRTQGKDKKVAPFRLNIGICGRVGADGTVPGPARCQPVVPDPTRRTLPPTVVQPPRPADVTWEQVG